VLRDWSPDSEGRCRGYVVETCWGREGVGEDDAGCLPEVFEEVRHDRATETCMDERASQYNE